MTTVKSLNYQYFHLLNPLSSINFPCDQEEENAPASQHKTKKGACAPYFKRQAMYAVRAPYFKNATA